jgi:hypothetical protein
MNNNTEQLETSAKKQAASSLGDMFAAVCSGKREANNRPLDEVRLVLRLSLLPSSRNFVDFLASQTRGLHQDGEKDTRPLSHFRPLAALLFTDRRPPAAHSFADTTGGRPIITYHSLPIFNAPIYVNQYTHFPPHFSKIDTRKRSAGLSTENIQSSPPGGTL